MSTMSTASGPISPFFFPYEILGEIFSHCDAPTLAAVSLVSFDCLALSAKLLYEDVTLDTAQALARLLRIPHPDTTPGFDRNDAAFDANYPDGFPIPARPLPNRNRVAPYTSLSLIHSVTFTGDPDGGIVFEVKDDLGPFAFLHSLAAVQPLKVAVLVVAAPEARYGYWIGPFMTLFDPVTFVVHAPLDEDPRHNLTHVELRGDAPRWTKWDKPWSRLTTVILFGVQLHGCEQFSVGERLIKVFVDLTWARETSEDPDLALPIASEFAWLNAAFLSGVHRAEEAPEVFKVWAWVSTDTMKRITEERVESNKPGGLSGTLGKHTFVTVASERILRFRDKLYRGVHKKMDWAALEEM